MVPSEVTLPHALSPANDLERACSIFVEHWRIDGTEASDALCCGGSLLWSILVHTMGLDCPGPAAAVPLRSVRHVPCAETRLHPTFASAQRLDNASAAVDEHLGEVGSANLAENAFRPFSTVDSALGRIFSSTWGMESSRAAIDEQAVGAGARVCIESNAHPAFSLSNFNMSMSNMRLLSFVDVKFICNCTCWQSESTSFVVSIRNCS